MEGLCSADPPIDARVHAPLRFLSKALRAYPGDLPSPSAGRTTRARIGATEVEPASGSKRTDVVCGRRPLRVATPERSGRFASSPARSG